MSKADDGIYSPDDIAETVERIRAIIEAARDEFPGYYCNHDDGRDDRIDAEDLIADLLHFAAAVGYDGAPAADDREDAIIDGVIRAARRNYEAERNQAAGRDEDDNGDDDATGADLDPTMADEDYERAHGPRALEARKARRGAHL